jgi:Xaa-Pro aminopeptidase
MDVHDVGAYQVDGRSRLLKPGMVLTVEPGLYFPEDADMDDKWKGIGVRIEDDILVTEHDPEILSKDVPKTIEAIEQLMQNAL